MADQDLAANGWPLCWSLACPFGPEEPWIAIVGVASDVTRAWNQPVPSQAVYLPFRQHPSRNMSLLLRAEEPPGGVLDAVRRSLWARDDALVLPAAVTLEEAILERGSGIRWAGKMVGGIAVAALLICLAGIYAMVAYAAANRTQELGVRIALGARRRDIVRLLVRQGLVTSPASSSVFLPSMGSPGSPAACREPRAPMGFCLRVYR